MSMRFLQLLILVPFTIFAQSNQLELADEYYQQGEVEKALSIYEDLASDAGNYQDIHENYYELLIAEKKYKKAERYLNDAVKKYPANFGFQVDLGVLYYWQQDSARAKRYFDEFFQDIAANKYKVRLAARYLADRQLYSESADLYQQSRAVLNEPQVYALELASLYQVQNKREEMIGEYLRYLEQNPRNLAYIQNRMSRVLESEDLKLLQNVLNSRIQRDPSNNSYTELMIWAMLQQSNFYGAYIQALAFDKRTRNKGEKTLNIGKIALNNKEYELAIKIFESITEEFPNTMNYVLASRYLIKAREELVKNTFPVDKGEIQKLILSYDKLIRKVGLNRNSMDILRDKARLHAFYLGELDTAIALLNQIIRSPASDGELIARSKMDLGDIYILDEQPWESSLLFSQVEKAFKDSPLAYEAKFKNAQLYYFKSEFELAIDYLNILKMATSREIANDALSLSLLIQNNLDRDSVNAALKEFAGLDLMVFQNRKDKALPKYDSFLEKYDGHSLSDEVMFRQATIFTEAGEYDKALEKYNTILDQYGSDILADDAQFKIAELYHYHYNNPGEAMNSYQKILTEFKGSIFTSEARKRFRILRGDFNDVDL